MAKKPITITIEEQVVNDGKERADKDNRSLSNHIEWLLIKDAREEGNENKMG